MLLEFSSGFLGNSMSCKSRAKSQKNDVWIKKPAYKHVCSCGNWYTMLEKVLYQNKYKVWGIFLDSQTVNFDEKN